ncbi:MAG: dacB [Marmoricola sp.]|nr:dacB [Marmoricola sp.]
MLLVVLAAFGNVQYDLGHRWLGLEARDPASAPSQVRAPAGLDLAAGTPAPAVARTAVGGSLAPAAVRRALAPYLSDDALGSHVAVRVTELGSGRVVFRRGPASVIPASTNKLLTGAAALEALGPMTRFRTSVVGSGSRIVLVGGGDPFLASRPAKATTYPARANLVVLARRTAAALKAQGTTKVSLGYDASRFTGPAVNPHWPADYVPDGVVPPISALWVDEAKDGAGRYVTDPAAVAAGAFGKALGRQGITVTGLRELAAEAGAPTLASVSSAPVGEIVQQTLTVSDNNAAEVLARQVGVAAGDASFAGSEKAVFAVLRGLGVRTAGSRAFDGSGLSRDNRLTPAMLTDVLRAAASGDHPRLREVITGLPVAGFTGSLANRFDEGAAAARGRVRAKTGTLTGVHGLAGIASDVDGNLMVLVLVADRVPTSGAGLAPTVLDKMAGALGACHCGAAGPQ